MIKMKENKKLCTLCKRIVNGNNTISLPNFIQNKKDDLYILNEAVIHVDCIPNFGHKDKLHYILGEMKKNTAPKDQQCIVDGTFSENFDDMLSLGLLSSNPSEDIYMYNFLNIKKSNISLWDNQERFVRILKELKTSNSWLSDSSFNLIDYLISVFDITTINNLTD